MTEEQIALLAAIKVYPFLGSITTFTDAEEDGQRELHEACMQLEALGKLRRYHEVRRWVIWETT